MAGCVTVRRRRGGHGFEQPPGVRRNAYVKEYFRHAFEVPNNRTYCLVKIEIRLVLC